LGLPSDSKTQLERVFKGKPSSLLGLVVSDEEKRFYNFDYQEIPFESITSLCVDNRGTVSTTLNYKDFCIIDYNKTLLKNLNKKVFNGCKFDTELTTQSIKNINSLVKRHGPTHPA
jgi:hypothetical protein